MEKIYDYEDRLVRFAGEVLLFVKTVPKEFGGNYYNHQVIRSSGSAALNYGEAQGTITTKDFIHKMSIVLKELKESKVALKVLRYVKMGAVEKRNWLLQECQELSSIGAKMIINRQKGDKS